MTEFRPLFDRRQLDLRRTRAARRPDASKHVFLLEAVVADVVDRLSLVRRAFPRVLVLGAHDGTLGRTVAQRPGTETVVEVEPCRALLARCTGARVLGPIDDLPFAPESFDLVVSALALQTVDDLPGVFAQVRQILKPDGLLLASLCGGGTLDELRVSLLAAEAEIDGGAGPRVGPFVDVRGLGSLLQRAQLALPVVDSDAINVTYADMFALLHDLRGMGATNVLLDRRRFLSRAAVFRAAAIYAERFPAERGRIRATFDIVTALAWCPHVSQQQALKPGSAKVRMADALKSAAERK
jgi:SAM-dependent methyltransferase